MRGMVFFVSLSEGKMMSLEGWYRGADEEGNHRSQKLVKGWNVPARSAWLGRLEV